MRIFITSVVSFIGLQMIVCFVLFMAGRNSSFFDPNNYLASSIDKHYRLDSLGSPRLILVGGSNLAFGVDSKYMEQRLGMPVVNMATHAGLGMDFILSEVEPTIN